MSRIKLKYYVDFNLDLSTLNSMSTIELKLIGRGSNFSTVCVDNLVKLHFRIGFNNKEILAVLAQNHSVVISVRTLKRLCGKLRLFRRRTWTDMLLVDIGTLISSRQKYIFSSCVALVWFCAKTAKISLLLNAILKYNFAKLSTQAIGFSAGPWSGCYPSQLISTVF